MSTVTKIKEMMKVDRGENDAPSNVDEENTKEQIKEELETTVETSDVLSCAEDFKDCQIDECSMEDEVHQLDEQTKAILALKDVIFEQQAMMDRASKKHAKVLKKLKKLSKQNRVLRKELKLANKMQPEPETTESSVNDQNISFVWILSKLNDMRKKEKNFFIK